MEIDWLSEVVLEPSLSIASVEGSQGSQSEYPMPLGLGVKQEADRETSRSLFISFPVNENLSLGQPFSLTKAEARFSLIRCR